MSDYACAECGSTTATTYVVTQLDPNEQSTRTEVCRACDDALREERGVTLTYGQLSAWAGRTLTADEIAELDTAIGNSSIPEAISVIADNLGGQS